MEKTVSVKLWQVDFIFKWQSNKKNEVSFPEGILTALGALGWPAAQHLRLSKPEGRCCRVFVSC